MFQILLIDDESTVLKGIKVSVNWNKFNISKVYTANNGTEAIELVQKYNPEIVITDIKMPNINGLELARKILEINKTIKIIALSGYDDYDYVRSFMKMGGIDYLLKPIAIKEIEEAIKKAQELLKKEGAVLDYNSEILRRKHLIGFLNGKINIESLNKQFYKSVNLSFGFSIYIMKIIKKDVNDTAYAFYDDYKLTEKFNSFFKEFFNCDIILIDNNMFVSIIGIKDITSKSLMEKNIVFSYDRLKSFIEIYYKMEIKAAYGEMVDNFADLPISYISAKNAFDCTFYKQGSEIISYKDIKFDKSNIDYFQYDDNITKCLNGSDLNGIQEEFNKLRKEITEKYEYKQYDSNEIKLAYVKLLSNLLRNAINLYNADQSIIKSEIETLEKSIYQSECYTELIRLSQKTVIRVEELYEKVFLNKKISMITKINQYITDNYNKNLTLEDISSHISRTPTYIANAYKIETGETIFNYLTKIRISKAKELLKDNHFSLNDIALKVGYNNAKYFGQVFRKSVGLTLKDYRLKTRYK